MLTHLEDQNWASEALIQHTSKSSSNEHVKQDQYKSSRNSFPKQSNIWISTYWGAQNYPKIWTPGANFLHTSKSSSNELKNQVQLESSGKFSQK